MSYIFLLEQGEESAVECFSDIPRSVLSRLSLTEQKCCSSGSGTESCPAFRFGMMFGHSTVSLGMDWLMSCAVGSHARTLVLPEREPDYPGNQAVYGRRCGESFARFDHKSCSWKIPQLWLFEDLEQSLETWPRWGLMLAGECWEQSMPELLIGDLGYGLWQT